MAYRHTVDFSPRQWRGFGGIEVAAPEIGLDLEFKEDFRAQAAVSTRINPRQLPA